MNIATRHNTRPGTRRTNFVALAIAGACAISLAAPVQYAVASPKPEIPTVVLARLDPCPSGCADQLHDLFGYFRAIGFTGHASRIAAELTLSGLT